MYFIFVHIFKILYLLYILLIFLNYLMNKFEPMKININIQKFILTIRCKFNYINVVRRAESKTSFLREYVNPKF